METPRSTAGQCANPGEGSRGVGRRPASPAGPALTLTSAVGGAPGAPPTPGVGPPATHERSQRGRRSGLGPPCCSPPPWRCLPGVVPLDQRCRARERCRGHTLRGWLGFVTQELKRRGRGGRRHLGWDSTEHPLCSREARDRKRLVPPSAGRRAGLWEHGVLGKWGAAGERPWYPAPDARGRGAGETSGRQALEQGESGKGRVKSSVPSP